MQIVFLEVNLQEMSILIVSENNIQKCHLLNFYFECLKLNWTSENSLCFVLVKVSQLQGYIYNFTTIYLDTKLLYVKNSCKILKATENISL